MVGIDSHKLFRKECVNRISEKRGILSPSCHVENSTWRQSTRPVLSYWTPPEFCGTRLDAGNRNPEDKNPLSGAIALSPRWPIVLTPSAVGRSSRGLCDTQTLSMCSSRSMSRNERSPARSLSLSSGGLLRPAERVHLNISGSRRGDRDRGRRLVPEAPIVT